MKKEIIFFLFFVQNVYSCEHSYFLSKKEIITLENQYNQGMLVYDVIVQAEYLANAAQHRAHAFLYTLFSKQYAHKDIDVRIQHAFFVARMHGDDRIQRFVSSENAIHSIQDLEIQNPLRV